MKRPPRIWVVEMHYDGKWETTVGIGLSRAAGRVALDDWQAKNPSDKFRLRAYVAAPDKPKAKPKRRKP